MRYIVHGLNTPLAKLLGQYAMPLSVALLVGIP